jgi:excisionase family DNA binding protein
MSEKGTPGPRAAALELATDMLAHGVPPDLISTSEAAKLAKVSLWSLYRWVAAGLIPAWRRGGRIFISKEDALGTFKRIVPARPAVLSAREQRLRREATEQRLRELGVKVNGPPTKPAA